MVTLDSSKHNECMTKEQFDTLQPGDIVAFRTLTELYADPAITYDNNSLNADGYSIYPEMLELCGTNQVVIYRKRTVITVDSDSWYYGRYQLKHQVQELIW